MTDKVFSPGEVLTAADVNNYLISPGRGNEFINGAFDFWQRGTGPFTVDGNYTADRWQMHLSGATAAVSRQAFTAGQTDVAGNPTYFLRLAVSTGDNAVRIEQKVEDAAFSSGKTFTASFWAKGTNPGGGVVEVFYRQEFGVGGSAPTAASAGFITLTGSWQRFTKTFTYPSVAGKTIGPSSWYGLDIRQPVADTSTAAWTLDLANVQLELGSVATPFKRNANSLQGELAACQRYYVRFTSAATNEVVFPHGPAANTTNWYSSSIAPVPLRVAPTSVEYANVAIQNNNDGNFTPSSITNSNSSAGVLSIVGVSTSLTQFRNYQLRTTALGGFIGFSAEL